MSDSSASYRRILKTSSVVGGSTIGKILIYVGQVKVIAMLLGPVGMGLFSLYTAVMNTATAVASMGLDTAGTRVVAEAAAKEDLPALTTTRRALFRMALVLACVGGLVVWALRGVIAAHLLGGNEHANAVGWLALGVALSVAGASQGALLRGMRRIGDLARWNVIGAAAHTIVGIILIWRFGQNGLVASIIVGPLVFFILGQLYVSHLPRLGGGPVDWRLMISHWRTILRTGSAFMSGALAATLVQLWIRVAIQGSLGTEEVGHYQAAWLIGTQYLGFVLGAMAADYYPRLTGVMGDKEGATRLVNEQTEVGLLLGAPVIVLMLGIAPWMVTLLYSSEFAPAAAVLRWTVLGDVFRMASWPLGYVIIAAGAAKTFLLTEVTPLLLMGALVTALTPLVGLQMTGIASLVSQVYYLPLVYFLVRRRINFAWAPSVVRLVVLTLVLCTGVAVLTTMFDWGVFVAVGMSVLYGFYSLGRVSHVSDLKGPIGRVGSFAYAVTSKIGLQRD